MKMFVYVIDSDVRGIVLAADQEEAVKKVMDAYIDHGGPEFNPECVNTRSFLSKKIRDLRIIRMLPNCRKFSRESPGYKEKIGMR